MADKDEVKKYPTKYATTTPTFGVQLSGIQETVRGENHVLTIPNSHAKEFHDLREVRGDIRAHTTPMDPDAADKLVREMIAKTPAAAAQGGLTSNNSVRKPVVEQSSAALTDGEQQQDGTVKAPDPAAVKTGFAAALAKNNNA